VEISDVTDDFMAVGTEVNSDLEAPPAQSAIVSQDKI
jgi:hypothetical protein